MDVAHDTTLASTPGRTGAAAEQLAAGATCGDYVVESFLGAGAMGEVYAGRHPVIGKRVAIKVLRRELAADPEAAERFVREAKAVNQIEHANVIDVFNFGRLADGRLYLVMDLVDGRSLRALVKAGPLPVERTLAILGKVADALDAAHARGVVHRDLKPDNVMIGEADQVFVLDFGIAKLVGEHGGGTLTAKGSWLGTPSYMAPEQWSSDGAGPASDRYALGVMAYELLSGKLPFAAPTLPQMMEQHFRAKVPALDTVANHATIDPVLARAMAKQPGERYATARALVDALREAAAGRAPARRRSLVVPAIAGAAVLGLAIAAIALRGGGTPDDDDRRPDPPQPPAVAPAYARVTLISQPAGASVRRDGQRAGLTPVTLDVRPGVALAIDLAKPGYQARREDVAAAKLAAGAEVVVRAELAAITSFEGVWAMPDGQLRHFARTGDQIDVSKLASVGGPHELWRRFDLVEPPDGLAGVVFAASVDMPDERGGSDASCRAIPHRIEYHYDPDAAKLAVRAERVATDRQGERCFVRAREMPAWTQLARADGTTADTRWTTPPTGQPRQPSPRRPVQADNTVQRNAPPNADNAGQTVQQPAPNQAPQPPQQAPNRPRNAPTQQQQSARPRGDSQVAPQVGN